MPAPGIQLSCNTEQARPLSEGTENSPPISTVSNCWRYELSFHLVLVFHYFLCEFLYFGKSLKRVRSKPAIRHFELALVPSFLDRQCQAEKAWERQVLLMKEREICTSRPCPRPYYQSLHRKKVNINILRYSLPGQEFVRMSRSR